MCIAIEASNKTPGGLHIPDSAKSRVNEGLVVAVGPLTSGAYIGETIIFPPHAEYRFKKEGVEYILVKDGEILCGSIPQSSDDSNDSRLA